MKLYYGVDLHSNNSPECRRARDTFWDIQRGQPSLRSPWLAALVSVIDETDKLLADKRLGNDLGQILAAPGQ